jgi:rod shape-determining protein MreC
LLGHWLKPVGNMALTVAAPFEAVISAAATTLGDAVSGVVEGPSLRAENERLRLQNETLIRHNIALQQQAHENELLRRMLRYSDPNNRLDLLKAQVIGSDPNNLAQYIIINRGSRDGLRVGMTVLDQGGYFVGSIEDLMSNASKVLLMTSPSSSVGAIDLQRAPTPAVHSSGTSSPETLSAPGTLSSPPGR